MFSVRKTLKACSTIFASLCLLHCAGNAVDAPSAERVGTTASEGDSFEEFKAGLEQVEPGTYKVDGDILVSEKDLPSYYAEHHENPQALTVAIRSEDGPFGGFRVLGRKVWDPWVRWDLKYCVSDSFGDKKARIVSAMEKATRAWQVEAGADLVFRYVSAEDANCTTGNPNINISVEYKEDLPDAFGDAWVGPQFDSTGREYNRIRISPASFDAWQINVNSFGVLDLASVAAHELGHVLGFYHEHDNPASGACSTGSTYSYRTHQALTGYDPASIMHYRLVQRTGCTSSTYAWLTESDRQGARIAYPPTASTPAPQPQCLKGSYGRGAGTVPTTCGDGQEKNGALCYPACEAGYKGVGPVCWQSCPDGYTDDGALCRRDASIISANNGSCPWYDKCGLTFAKGCSSCPSGYTNDGCTCRRDVHIFAKRSYGRGVGSPLTCGSGKQLDAGLCYPGCSLGYKGVGPVCWEDC